MFIPGYLGDFPVGATIDFKFTTTLSSGVDTPGALASGALTVYRDNETTENNTGLTYTSGFDAKTGMNHVRITTASDATFYARGHNYMVMISAGDQSGDTRIGIVVAQFSIEHRTQRYTVT